MMETITIPKQEYEELKRAFTKISFIDKTIHQDISLSTKKLMKLQEKQKSFAFLKNKEEDVYSLEDLKEVY